MKKIHFTFIAIGLVLMGCASNPSKNVSDEQIKQFDDMITSENYEIVFSSAQPMASTGMQAVANAGLLAPGSNLGRIDLIGNPNYMRKIGDSISVSLPYYGERQIGGAYNNSKEVGINYEGTPFELTMNKSEKNGSYSISYSMKNNTETFVVNSVLYPNGSARATVTSSHRRAISYRGRVKVLSESDDPDS